MDPQDIMSNTAQVFAMAQEILKKDTDKSTDPYVAPNIPKKEEKPFVTGPTSEPFLDIKSRLHPAENIDSVCKLIERQQLPIDFVGYVARGGMGVTYSVVAGEKSQIAKGNGRDMILKVSHFDAPYAEKFFEREMITQMESSEIATVPDVYAQGRDEVLGISFVLMEYIEGVELSRHVLQLMKRKEMMPIDEIINVGIDVAESLGSMHQSGIYHGDVKSDNVILGDNGLTYLLDFGLARHFNDQRIHPEGLIMGTPSTMAPEIRWWGADVDQYTDQFSLGHMLYAITTGKRPLAQITQRMVVAGQETGNYSERFIDYFNVPDPRRFRSDCPPYLAETIMKAISFSSEKRFDSCEDVADALRLIQFDYE